jgi:mycobactin peptide synthetase MbtE
VLTPATTRDPHQRAGRVGCQINPVVLRVDLAAASSWRALLHHVRRVVLDAYQHSRVGVEEALAAAGTPPLVGIGANRYVMLNVIERGFRLALAGCPPSHGRLVVHDVAGCDVEILLSPQDDAGMRLEVTYRRAQWDRATLERVVRDLHDCVERLGRGSLDEPPRLEAP